MALQKEIITLDNNTGNYWRIMSRNFDDSVNVGTSVFVSLGLFKDKDSRMLPALPIQNMQRNYSFPGDLSKAECYAMIKEKDAFFSDAENV